MHKENSKNTSKETRQLDGYYGDTIVFSGIYQESNSYILKNTTYSDGFICSPNALPKDPVTNRKNAIVLCPNYSDYEYIDCDGTNYLANPPQIPLPEKGQKASCITEIELLDCIGNKKTTTEFLTITPDHFNIQYNLSEVYCKEGIQIGDKIKIAGVVGAYEQNGKKSKDYDYCITKIVRIERCSE